MKKCGKLISLLLLSAMLLGALPARAAEVTGGLLGESFKTGEVSISSTYTRTTNSKEIQNYDWPDSGYIFLIVTSNYPLSGLNGVTIPPNIVIDAYQYHTGGTYTFLARFDTTDGSSLTVVDASKNITTSTSDVAGFNDVKAGDYFADAVKWAKETGVTSGTGPATFSPAATVTRAEAVTFLWRAAGSPEPASSTSPFTDVTDTGAYYYKAVLWAVEQGITNGAGAGRFDLTGTLAYDQILTFLCRAGGGTASGDDWSAAAVSWAAGAGLTDGLTFTAKGSCPRSDVVYCLWKQLSGEAAGTTPVQLGQPDLAGARAAIIKGLSQCSTIIDLNAYNLSVSQVEALAAELTANGEHAMFVKYYRVNENPVLKNASTLSVGYDGNGTSDYYDQVRARVASISASVVEPGMSDYDTAKALHDYLVLNCAYDSFWDDASAPMITSNARNAYGALIDGGAVCVGYATAYSALLRYNGIECIYVTNISHTWNIVKIGGEWYHVDTTWDDPVPDRAGYVRYNYFLKSDAVFQKDHATWTQGQQSPLQGECQWTPAHACTSTKYDAVTLPSSTEQANQAAQAADQERLDTLAEEVVAYYLSAIADLPYSTAAQLQAAPSLGYTDTYATIELPSGQYSSTDLSKVNSTVRERLSAALAAQYPDYELSSLLVSSCRIKRNDVAREIERRQSARQAETDVRVAEIEELLRDAIRSGDYRVKSYKVQLPSGYTSTEVKKAVSNITAAGYSFDGYTAKVDYSITSYSSVLVTINNLRRNAWVEEETLRYVETIQDAIRNGEAQVTLQPGSYPDDAETYFASLAAARVKAAGYSFDGLTAGVDYTITRTGVNSSKEFIIWISYPER